MRARDVLEVIAERLIQTQDQLDQAVAGIIYAYEMDCPGFDQMVGLLRQIKQLIPDGNNVDLDVPNYWEE